MATPGRRGGRAFSAGPEPPRRAERRSRTELRRGPRTVAADSFVSPFEPPWPPGLWLSSRLAGAFSRRPAEFDFGDERVRQFHFGRRDSPSGNMDAKLGEPVELDPEPLGKDRREQGGRDGDDEEAGAGRAIACGEGGRVEGPVRAREPRRENL